MDYLRLGVPAMLMLCLEWWTFEIQTFMASFISVEDTATQVILLNTMYVLFGFTLGLQYASSTLVGKAIGAMNIKEAKRYRNLVIFIGFAMALMLALSLFIFRGSITRFYT